LKEFLRTNESATVTWRFNCRVEYIKPGSRLIFREGSTKGMGEVVEIVPYDESGSSSDEIRQMGKAKRRLAGRKSSRTRLSQSSPDHKAKAKNLRLLIDQSAVERVDEMDRSSAVAVEAAASGSYDSENLSVVM
jgi:hypothetical protein